MLMQPISMAFVETASEEQAMAVKGWLENKFVSSILIILKCDICAPAATSRAGESMYIYNLGLSIRINRKKVSLQRK